MLIFVELYHFGVKKKTIPYFSRKALPTELWLFMEEVTGRADRVTAVNTVLPESTEIAKLSNSTQTVQDEIFSLKSYNNQTSNEQTERSFDL